MRLMAEIQGCFIIASTISDVIHKCAPNATLEEKAQIALQYAHELGKVIEKKHAVS